MLRIFPYGQYIIESVIFVAFWRHSQVQNRNGGCEEMYKNVNTVSDEFLWRHSTPALLITSLSLAGVYCESTLLGRCLCRPKRVDVYIITLSCRAYLADICTHWAPSSCHVVLGLMKTNVCVCVCVLVRVTVTEPPKTTQAPTLPSTGTTTSLAPIVSFNVSYG